MMTEKGAYTNFVKSLQKEGRIVHLNLRRGLFVLASDCESYHDLTLTKYCISGFKALFSPRLIVNRNWSSNRLPSTVARRWGLKSGGAALFAPTPELKLTFSPIDLDNLSKGLPMIIDHIERGNRDGFEQFLAYKVVSHTPRSIWSYAADTFAKTGVYFEPDPVTVIHVNRDGVTRGEFYLSQVELGLKLGDFTNSDEGRTDKCSHSAPLRHLAKSLRSINGNKQLATTTQRAYLKRCGMQLWKGISNREASHVITELAEKYSIPPGDWINKTPTEKQISILASSCQESLPLSTRGDASIAIGKLFNESS